MPRFKNETIHTDRTTGEITAISRTYNRPAKNSEEFYMAYIQTVAMFMKINSMEDVRLLAKLCTLMSYGTNEVLITPPRRKEIATELGIHDTTISRSLARLKEIGVISGERGTYLVNPIFYWKGTNDSRDKLLREKGLTLKIQFGGPESE